MCFCCYTIHVRKWILFVAKRTGPELIDNGSNLPFCFVGMAFFHTPVSKVTGCYALINGSILGLGLGFLVWGLVLL